MALHAANLDCFPSRGPIRVVAANLAGDIRPLVGLVKQIEQRCQYLGFVQERRPYQPHVTLARARNGLAAGLRESLQQATRSAWPGPEFPIRQFVLMQSKLNATGSEYRVVESFGVA